jgi:adenylate cyclase
VLAGNVVRGRAEPISAVVWFSDLVGFTRISDKIGAEDVLAMLNDYAQVQIETIEAHAGHVLKFLGDGLLAIFPDDDTTKACARALDAATKDAEAHRGPQRQASGLGPPGDRHAPRAPRRRAPLRQPGRPAPARLHRARIGSETKRRASRRSARRSTRR